MATLDWIMLAVLLASALLGAWRGLVYEVVSVLGWLASFVLAQWFAPEAALWLPMKGATEPLRYAAGFVLVFVAVAFAGGLLAWLTKKLVEAVGLRPVDRTLGAAFGFESHASSFSCFATSPCRAEQLPQRTRHLEIRAV